MAGRLKAGAITAEHGAADRLGSAARLGAAAMAGNVSRAMIRANQRPDSLHRRTGRYPQLHPRCGCLVHGYVLVEIARNPEARIRDISAAVALAERTVQALVAELGAAGYRTRSRTSRRTVYAVHHDRLFRAYGPRRTPGWPVS
jgi:hypothetical protein